MSAQGVVIHESYHPAENSWEHRKTSKIIWYHPEDNWGPFIYNLVQFEEDFNSRTEKWSGGAEIGYLRPDQFLDHLTVIKSTTPPIVAAVTNISYVHQQHPGMRSSILKKWEFDNISQAVNFKRDSNRFLGKFLNVNLSHSGSILIGCEQKNADIQFHIL